MVLALLAAVLVVYAFYTRRAPTAATGRPSTRRRNAGATASASTRWPMASTILRPSCCCCAPSCRCAMSRRVWCGARSPRRCCWLSAALTADALGWHPVARTRLLTGWWILCSVPTMLLVPLTGNSRRWCCSASRSSLWLFAAGPGGLGRRGAGAGAGQAATGVADAAAAALQASLAGARRLRGRDGACGGGVVAVGWPVRCTATSCAWSGTSPAGPRATMRSSWMCRGCMACSCSDGRTAALRTWRRTG